MKHEFHTAEDYLLGKHSEIIVITGHVLHEICALHSIQGTSIHLIYNMPLNNMCTYQLDTTVLYVRAAL